MKRFFAILCGLSLGLLLNAQNLVTSTHVVKKGETLYRISVNYNTTVETLQAFNADIVGYSIKVGQLLTVPVPTAVPTTVQTKTQASTSPDMTAADQAIKQLPPKEVVTRPIPSSQVPTTYTSPVTPTIKRSTPDYLALIKPVKHIVNDGETLFSVSKLYGESVNALKNWNDLKSYSIQPGQPLIVGWIAPDGVDVTDNGNYLVQDGNQQPSDLVPMSDAPIAPTRAMSAFEQHYNSMTNYPGLYKTITKSGLAQKFDDGNKGTGDGNMYALHKDAPLFSIIKVTNPINGRSIYAKVIEHLPKSIANSNVIVKLPKSAAQALKMFDQKTNVECTYHVPNK